MTLEIDLVRHLTTYTVNAAKDTEPLCSYVKTCTYDDMS